MRQLQISINFLNFITQTNDFYNLIKITWILHEMKNFSESEN